jgi:hypothetical protein
MTKKCVLFLLLLFAAGFAGSADELHTRAEVRKIYGEYVSFDCGSPYGIAPSVSAPYASGALTDAAQQGALAYVNFLRELAYLEGDVALDALYTLRAQYAAVLLAANDDLAHDAPRPEDMPVDFYETAHAGTMSSNIACINWMEDPILLTAVEFFARDDGEANLQSLGHRRWLLNPSMAMTGFGLANSASGLTYAVMYAHDTSRDAADWDSVAWPSAGAFPADLMSGELPWSVTLNPGVYDLASSDIGVSISEKDHGEAALGYFRVDTSGYGDGPCVIFVPDLEGMGIEDYQQNQEWTVRVTGLTTVDGSSAEICYTVDMMSLYPIDPVSVEMSALEAELAPGESFSLEALVIPQWADDVSISWRSTDETVATVCGGVVTAVGAGRCEIVAESVNGRRGSCAVAVE